MKNENEQSLEVYKNILFVESNKYTILPNKLAFKKSHPIFTANRSGVLRESNFHPVFTRYPSSCSRSRVTGTGQCIVDVHTKKTTGAFFFTRFLSPHFFFLIIIYLFIFFFSLFQQTSEYKR